MLGPDFATAAWALCQNTSAAMVRNRGSAAAHFRNARLARIPSSINRLQAFHNVLAAMLVTGTRSVARAIQIDADPSFIVDLLQNTVTGGEVDVAVTQVIDAFEEFRFRRIAFVDLAVRQRQVGLGR